MDLLRLRYRNLKKVNLKLKKEGLACIFGVIKFHAYLMGRHFELITDHKPLLSLFNEHKAIPSHASARIQRWALTLAVYEYTLVSRRTDAHTNADTLSRLPFSRDNERDPCTSRVNFNLGAGKDMPVTDQQIKTWTIQDPLLNKVVRTPYSTRLA